MNIRKNIDYSNMYVALDVAMAAENKQMELYWEIGKAVNLRSEKGAAVAAAEYLSKKYPNVQGFSPRNLRRMRDFYRLYENHPVLQALAMRIGWTQNCVIMEAELTMELREWYLKAAKQFDWSKAELTENIINNATEEIVLAIEKEMCYPVKQESETACCGDYKVTIIQNIIRHLIQRCRSRRKPKEGGLRRWPIMSCPLSLSCPLPYLHP